ncbi:MAG: RlmI/RlmK family 23S rRNA methyltransferase [Planctomycetota bacterium]|nr:MAG: RlmI/RlmK family 23S rRNA methyltransferase [Planctomycetota bacterium]
MPDLPYVKLKAKRNSVHPWIFLKMVARPNKRILPGQLVKVFSKEDEFIGIGFYNRKSNINIRLISENKDQFINEKFFYQRILNAVNLRTDILNIDANSDSYRIVHGEADLLSGLIIDKFNDTIVIEPFSAGYLHIMDWIINSLQKIFPDCQVTVRSDEKNGLKEGVDFSILDKKYPPKHQELTIREHNISMKVNLATGHKTGFFLDQRDNRKYMSSKVKDKDVLDLCCYSGGFAISAAKAGAKNVIGVDLDEKAIEMAQLNAKLNEVDVEFIHANTYDYLREAIKDNKSFDVIILDPPKLGRNKEELGKAKHSYHDLNCLAMQCVKDNGLLLTCSCTGSLSEQEFLSTLTGAANNAGVHMQFIKICGPGGDHPIMHSFPEGRYLKAVYARITKAHRTYHSVKKEDAPSSDKGSN